MTSFLKDIYLNHFVLLVKAIYNLCQESISPEEISESSLLLKTYVFYIAQEVSKYKQTVKNVERVCIQL